MPSETSASIEQAREALEQLLGEQRLEPDVVRACLRDPLYLGHLRATRDAPALRRLLLAHPPAPPRGQPAFEDADLVKSALAQLSTWAASGFDLVDDAAYAARLAACRACPNSASPQTLLQRAAALVSGGSRTICGLCGCVIELKARLATAVCPDVHPENDRLTRWNQTRPT